MPLLQPGSSDGPLSGRGHFLQEVRQSMARVLAHCSEESSSVSSSPPVLHQQQVPVVAAAAQADNGQDNDDKPAQTVTVLQLNGGVMRGRLKSLMNANAANMLTPPDGPDVVVSTSDDAIARGSGQRSSFGRRGRPPKHRTVSSQSAVVDTDVAMMSPLMVRRTYLKMSSPSSSSSSSSSSESRAALVTTTPAVSPAASEECVGVTGTPSTSRLPAHRLNIISDDVSNTAMSCDELDVVDDVGRCSCVKSESAVSPFSTGRSLQDVTGIRSDVSSSPASPSMTTRASCSSTSKGVANKAAAGGGRQEEGVRSKSRRQAGVQRSLTVRHRRRLIKPGQRKMTCLFVDEGALNMLAEVRRKRSAGGDMRRGAAARALSLLTHKPSSNDKNDSSPNKIASSVPAVAKTTNSASVVSKATNSASVVAKATSSVPAVSKATSLASAAVANEKARLVPLGRPPAKKSLLKNKPVRVAKIRPALAISSSFPTSVVHTSTVKNGVNRQTASMCDPVSVSTSTAITNASATGVACIINGKLYTRDNNLNMVPVISTSAAHPSSSVNTSHSLPAAVNKDGAVESCQFLHPSSSCAPTSGNNDQHRHLPLLVSKYQQQQHHHQSQSQSRKKSSVLEIPGSPTSHSYCVLQRRLEAATAQETSSSSSSSSSSCSSSVTGGARPVMHVEERARVSSRSNLATSRHREMVVKKFSNFHQIVMCPVTTRLRAGLNIQVMRELRECLCVCARDSSCRAVLLTSSAGAFCQGVDYSALLSLTGDKRRKHAQLLAEELRSLVVLMSEFEKPLIAGVLGDCVGAGVSLLPLCDLVYISDSATLRTLYHRLATVPEAGASHTLTSLLGHMKSTSLLMAGRGMSACEAVSCGLATCVLWSATAQQDLIAHTRQLVDNISQLQAVCSTKSLIRHNLRSKLAVCVEAECRLLVHQWCSDHFTAVASQQLYNGEHSLLLQRPAFNTQ